MSDVRVIEGKYYKRCEVCSDFFLTKKSHLERRKTCGQRCSNARKSIIYKGRLNPNFNNKGEESPLYKGPRINKYGYRLLCKPNHPNSDKRGYVLEHRYVLSEHLGRPLREDEIVHHKDGDKLNNDLDNLEIMDRSSHSKLHMSDYSIVRGELGRISGIEKKLDVK
ncbi:HNH endonuclease [Oceanobacillus neutriphilus]|uniref:HNH nuclease domain-containing protein n=1 Tax=Oceanobacillus neutriphilus TaxID=531815 RepID=A0ABQ2NYC5_9BACI|nr:HNH endonuclease [Oceanobacillus neutriphilus]GGP13518.1 hypothetical protein GCM10011346_33830 [Oceanobacillus neutriphilus]